MKYIIFLVASVCVANKISEKSNPIGQVLALLQKLHDTVVKDGEVEQKQFEKFAEWCEDEAKDRQFEIKTGKGQKSQP